jgi:hypothetical protein
MKTPQVFRKFRFLLATFFFLLAGLASLAGLRGTANAQIPPPTCPGPDCQKVITFYNNTSGPIYAVIQAGIQNPDPWLQALFNDNTHSYAETHYSRVYVNPTNGIPTNSHVSVTVPWYSKLQGDTDQYADWFNGCRVYIFDTKAALDAAHNADKNNQLTVTADSPIFSCDTCEQSLNIYKDTLAFPAETIPFQLLEYTFAQVNTDAKAFIINLNVGYNISYLDQIYLPIALTACRAEATCHQGQDATARGYLGTTQDLKDFRKTLGDFSNTEGWVQYNSTLDDTKNRPRLPGTFNVLVDRVNVVEKKQPSQFTFAKVGSSIDDLIKQWATCTSNKANALNCPQFQIYQEIDQYFKGNYNNYETNGNTTDCPNYNDPNYYPVPATLTSINIMPYVYGWVPFNSGCGAGFNALKDSPGPLTAFQQALLDYIHVLQYNYQNKSVKKEQRFNPFVDLVHGKLNANGYAFSVDDAVSFENQPGEGLIIAIGGATGLPNPTPVVPPPDYTVDFAVNLGDSKPLNRPRWKSYQVCNENAPFTDFPPLATDAPDTPQIIVDTVANNISPSNPCKITIKDASNRTFQFKISKPVPWPAFTPPGFDSSVMTCINPKDGWCTNINELSVPGAVPHFDLFTPPPPPLPGTRR